MTTDLLSGVPAIARYVGMKDRKVRHLIDHHEFPAVQRGRVYFSRKSWVDSYFSLDAPAAPANAEGIDELILQPAGGLGDGSV